MAKNVFHPVEIVDLTAQKVKVEAPVFEVDEPSPLDLYEGPTADDIRREAEAFRESWEAEKAAMVEAAKAEAEKITKDAEKAAFDEVKKKTDEAIRDKRVAEEESERLKTTAEEDAARLRSEAEAGRDEIRREARAESICSSRPSSRPRS